MKKHFLKGALLTFETTVKITKTKTTIVYCDKKLL